MKILNDRKDYDGLSLGRNILTGIKISLSENGYNYIFNEINTGVASLYLSNHPKIRSTIENIELYNELSVLEELAFNVSYEKEKRDIYIKKINEFLKKYKVNKKNFYNLMNNKIKVCLNILECEKFEDKNESEENEKIIDKLYEKDCLLSKKYSELYFRLYKEILIENNILSYKLIF